MTKSKDTNNILKHLQKQAEALRRREKITQKKLKTALLQVGKIIRTYESKLIKNVRATEMRVAAAEAAVYEKIAKEIQKKANKVKQSSKKSKK